MDAYVGTEVDGNVLWGTVIFIFARYNRTGEDLDTDIEFFNDTVEAQHDHYAQEVFAIIQDQGSDIEYPLNIKLLKKI